MDSVGILAGILANCIGGTATGAPDAETHTVSVCEVTRFANTLPRQSRPRTAQRLRQSWSWNVMRNNSRTETSGVARVSTHLLEDSSTQPDACAHVHSTGNMPLH